MRQAPQRIMTGLLGTLLLAPGVVLVTPVPAVADPPPADPCNTIICDDDGDVILNPEDPGSPGDPGDGETGDTGGTRECIANDRVIPCTSPTGGSWYQEYACYLELAPGGGPPPPDAINPDGAWYMCQPYGLPPTTIWIDDPPVQLPSPAELAQTALARMNLEPIEIGIVPEDGPDRLGVVGMPAWMWVKNPSANTFGPITESATAGTLTVTATARVDSIVWNMGDGTTITCTTDGTPYEDRFGDSDSPDCGHRYEQTSWDQPRHKFTVTATAQWTVEWEGGGQSGVIPIDHTAATQIRVGELQVLTQ